jgi:hypothetical protein
MDLGGGFWLKSGSLEKAARVLISLDRISISKACKFISLSNQKKYGIMTAERPTI